MARTLTSPNAGCPAWATTKPHTPGPEPKIPAPQRYDGRSGGCRPFLTQCSLIFQLQPHSFASEAARIAYIITLLSDRALLWATALVEKKSPICDSLEVFTHNLRQVFDHPVSGREAARRLLDLRQGPQTVVDYTIQFRTLAEETGWEEEAMISTFYHGLAEEIKDELATRDWGYGLEVLITLAIRIDNRRLEHQRERGSKSLASSSLHPQILSPAVPQTPPETPLTTEEPMQLGRARLSQQERERRWREGRCL